MVQRKSILNFNMCSKLTKLQDASLKPLISVKLRSIIRSSELSCLCPRISFSPLTENSVLQDFHVSCQLLSRATKAYALLQ